MTIVYAKDYQAKAVQRLIEEGAEVRNPQFFKNDRDPNAKVVHIFGDYPQIEKAFTCKVVTHSNRPEGDSKPDKPEGNELDGGKRQGYPVHTHAGWYELSDGEKVRGKEAAHAAQLKIDQDEG